MQNYQIAVTGCAVYQNRILLVQRAKHETYNPGKYEMPGGKVDQGETPIQALRREFKEETGLEISVKEPYYLFSYRSSDHRHFLQIVYLVDVISNPNDVRLSEDHSKYVWSSVTRIKHYLEKADEDVYKAAQLGVQKRFGSKELLKVMK